MKTFQIIRWTLLSVVMWIGYSGYSSGIQVPVYLAGYEDAYAENPREAALQWFKEAEFGMFIHYGLYSLAEGYWGDVHSRPAEWVQLRAKIRPSEYAKLTESILVAFQKSVSVWG